MYTRSLNLEDPSWPEREYDGVVDYAETRRVQLVHSELGAEELRGSPVVVYAMHPGWADTAAVKSSLPRFHRITRNILRTPAEGADTVVWLAAFLRARQSTGSFFFDRHEQRLLLGAGPALLRRLERLRRRARTRANSAGH